MNNKMRKKIALLCIVGMVTALLVGNTPPFCKTAKAIVGVFRYGGVTYERSLKDNLFYAVKYETTEEYPTLEMPPSLWNSSRSERYVIGGIKENLFENYCFQSIRLHTNGVYTIGANAFKNASTIGDVSIVGNFSEICSGAFQGFSCGGEFTISGNIDVVRESAFEGLKSELFSVGDMYIIEEEAFADSDLENITISSNVQTIGTKAFANCTGLQSITLPVKNDYLKEIAVDAFPDNEGLVIKVPAGCQDITVYHFENYNNIIFELDSSFTTEDTVYMQLEDIGAEVRFAGATATPQPTVTPEVTQEPEPTVTPEVTKEPEPTVTPEVTQEPEPTVTPEVTKEPEPTVTPEVTKEPEPTVTPEVTKEPEPTVTPEVTKEPEPTVTPEVTKEPQLTVTPEVTKEPEPTVTPESKRTFEPSQVAGQNEDGSRNVINNSSPQTVKSLKTGDTFVRQGLSYRILSKKEVACEGAVSKKEKVIVIPGTVKCQGITYSVTKISIKAFYNMKKLEKVTIGNQVTIIEKSSFEKCKKLKKVIFGKSVTTLKSRAFYLDTNLKILDFSGNKLKKVGRRVFSKSKIKKTVLIPQSGKKTKYYRLLQKSIV